jgi:hypothetical protein
MTDPIDDSAVLPAASTVVNTDSAMPEAIVHEVNKHEHEVNVGNGAAFPDENTLIDSAIGNSEQLEEPAADEDPELSEPQDEEWPDDEYHGTHGGVNVDIKTRVNRGQIVGQWFDAVQRHSGAPLPREWVEEQLKDYVPVKNEYQLAELLCKNHVLVITANNSGSGRWTAALKLLSSVSANQLTIRRIRREPGDMFNMDGLRGRKLSGWILDLRDPGESIPAAADLGHELAATSNLLTDDSYLVVVASAELWKKIGVGAEQLTAELEPPASINLFSTILSLSRIADYSIWAEKLNSRYTSFRPVQIRTLAQALIESCTQYREKNGRAPSPEVESEFVEIQQTVDNAYSGWMEELAKWHEAPDRTSYDRNYLLLAAVYDGDPIEMLHRKVASLAQALGEKGDLAETYTGQQGPGLIQLTRKIKADLLPDGSVRFPGPGFAEAVVRYFWLDRPNLTDVFTRWTVQLSLELKHPQGSQLAARLAPWVLHHAQATNSTRLLRLVASSWSEDENLAIHAHSLLVLASLDQEIGSRVRRAISSWINQEGTSAALLRTLARVFGTLTPAHPQMLGRLSELTGSTKEGVTDAVGTAINDLWKNVDIRVRLREILVSWLTAEDQVLRETAANAFLHLAAERDLNRQPIILHELSDANSDLAVVGWRAALETEEPNQTTDGAFILWLDTAATQSDSTEVIMTTLVRAVHDTPTNIRRGQRYLNLVRLSERWVLQSAVLNDQERKKLRRQFESRVQEADPRRYSVTGEDGTSIA